MPLECSEERAQRIARYAAARGLPAGRHRIGSPRGAPVPARAGQAVAARDRGATVRTLGTNAAHARALPAAGRRRSRASWATTREEWARTFDHAHPLGAALAAVEAVRANTAAPAAARAGERLVEGKATTPSPAATRWTTGCASTRTTCTTTRTRSTSRARGPGRSPGPEERGALTRFSFGYASRSRRRGRPCWRTSRSSSRSRTTRACWGAHVLQGVGPSRSARCGEAVRRRKRRACAQGRSTARARPGRAGQRRRSRRSSAPARPGRSTRRPGRPRR